MAFGKTSTPANSKEDGTTQRSFTSSHGTTAGGSSNKAIEAFLGKGSRVVGNVQFTGPAEIDGYIEGEVNAKAKLEIGESAVIKAKVHGCEVVVRGTVTGDITASEKLLLMKPAKVVGNITSANLSIEEGVVFEGSCIMKSVSTPIAQGAVKEMKS